MVVVGGAGCLSRDGCSGGGGGGVCGRVGQEKSGGFYGGCCQRRFLVC